MVDTEDWTTFLAKIKFSRSKSNRDLFCTKCWCVYSYEMTKKHISQSKSHKKFILTTKYYATEAQMKDLAFVHKQMRINADGSLAMNNPYFSVYKRSAE